MHELLSQLTTFISMGLALFISQLGAVRLGMERKFGYLIATVFPLLLCFLSAFAFLFGTGIYPPGAAKRNMPQLAMSASEILDLWPGALWGIAFCLIFGVVLIFLQQMIEDDD